MELKTFKVFKNGKSNEIDLTNVWVVLKVSKNFDIVIEKHEKTDLKNNQQMRTND